MGLKVHKAAWKQREQSFGAKCMWVQVRLYAAQRVFDSSWPCQLSVLSPRESLIQTVVVTGIKHEAVVNAY